MVIRYLAIIICTVMFCLTAASQKKEKFPNFQKHYVRDRETASSIAKDFSLKLRDFLLLNDFPADVKLKPGQIVLIRQLKDGEKVAEEKAYSAPKQHEETSFKSDEDDETRSVSEKPVETKKHASVETKTEEKKETSANSKPESTIEMLTGPNGAKYELSSGGFHVVQKGQTFYRIALIYHLTINELKALNNMTTTDIKVGQELKISK